jgi:hypothetical protein
MHCSAIFRVSLGWEGEVHQCVGLAVRVKVGWSEVISWEKATFEEKWWTQTSHSLYLYLWLKLRDVISMASPMLRGDDICSFCESFRFMFSVVISMQFYGVL